MFALISPARVRIGALDRAASARVATLPSSPLDSALRDLTTAANAPLWIAVAGSLALHPGPARRGAVHGLAALALTGAVNHAVLKPRFRRARPDIATMPATRALPRRPHSTSFPSGHAATAAAFATAVTLADRRAGVLLAPLAAAVAYSRVHVGVHWPSDVIAGTAVGAVVAATVRRLWTR